MNITAVYTEWPIFTEYVKIQHISITIAITFLIYIMPRRLLNIGRLTGNSFAHSSHTYGLSCPWSDLTWRTWSLFFLNTKPGQSGQCHCLGGTDPRFLYVFFILGFLGRLLASEISQTTVLMSLNSVPASDSTSLKSYTSGSSSDSSAL